MRKRGVIAAVGVAAVLVLAIAPGTASANHLDLFGEARAEQAPATPLAEGVWAPLGGALGDVAIELPIAPLSAGVWVPLGGGFGDVTIEMAIGRLVGGLVVPAGGALGDVTVEETEPSAGVFAPLGGGLGDITIEKVLAPRTVHREPAAVSVAPTGNTCYLGACADATLAGALPDAGEVFGGGAHSYGLQQAIRLGL